MSITEAEWTLYQTDALDFKKLQIGGVSLLEPNATSLVTSADQDTEDIAFLSGRHIRQNPRTLCFCSENGVQQTRLYVHPVTSKDSTIGLGGRDLETLIVSVVAKRGESRCTITSGTSVSPKEHWPDEKTDKILFPSSRDPLPDGYTHTRVWSASEAGFDEARRVNGYNLKLVDEDPDLMILSADDTKDGRTNIYYARRGDPVEGETQWIPYTFTN